MTDTPPPIDSMILALLDASEAVATAEAIVRERSAERDVLIRELSAAGVTRRRVAELAKITHGRVQQILGQEPGQEPGLLIDTPEPDEVLPTGLAGKLERPRRDA